MLKKFFFYIFLPLILLFSVFYYGNSTIEEFEKDEHAYLKRQLASSQNSILTTFEVWRRKSFNEAHSLADSRSVHAFVKDKKESLIDYLRDIAKSEEIVAVVLQNKDGNIILSTDTNLKNKKLLADSFSYWNKVSSSFEPVFEKPFKSVYNFNSSFDHYAMLVTAPIRESNGDFLGAVTYIYNPTIVFTELMTTSRFGISGESYVFEGTGLLLSKSRFLSQLRELKLVKDNEKAMFNLRLFDPGKNLLISEDKNFAKTKLTYMVQSALADGEGENVDGYNDYRGVKVVGRWNWLDSYEIGVVTEIDYDEAFHDIILLKNKLLKISYALVVFFIIYFCLLYFYMNLFQKSKRKTKEAEEGSSYINSLLETLDKHAIVTRTDKKGKIIYANSMFEKLSKYSESELLGQDHRIINSSYHGKDFFEDMWKTINNKNTWSGVIKNKDKFGDFYWVDSTITPVLDNEGEIKEFVAIRTDVSALKVIEEEQRQAKENAIKAKADAERISEESKRIAHLKTSFMATVSHELRTPLNVMIGFMSSIDDSLSEKDLREQLSVVKSASYGLLDIVNSVLDLSQLDSGAVFPRMTKNDLNELTLEVIRLFSKEAKNKNLKIDHHFKNDHKIYEIDGGKYKHILNNIIMNAIQYSDKGVVNVEISTQVDDSNNDRVNITITDQGRGISQEKQKDIFNSFSEISRVDSGELKGLGLGLTIAKKLTDIMNGELVLESNVDKGTKVTVSFVLRKMEEKLKQESSTDSQDFNHLKVAVIDDNSTNLKMMKFMLKRFNISGDFYKDPLVFIEEFGNHSYDIVFMDQLMPQMKGSDAVIKIKETHHSKSCFISLSASTTPEDLALFEEVFDEVLIKPVKKETLKNILEKVAS